MSPGEITQEFQRLIQLGKIEFQEVDINELQSGWVRLLITAFLDTTGIKWWVGDIEISGAVCIKTADPYLQYIDAYTETNQFLWCTNDHHDAVHPDQAAVYLINHYCVGMTNN